MAEQLGELIIQIKADASKLNTELEGLRNKISGRSKDIEQKLTFKARIDTVIARSSISQLETYHKKLKDEFDRKVKLNVDSASLDKTREKLASVQSALAGVKPKMEEGLSFKARIDTVVARSSIQQLQQYRAKLQVEFDRKVALNVDATSLDRTRQKLSAVTSALSGVTSQVGVTQQTMGVFSQTITGLNQAFELVRSTYSILKNEFQESVMKSENFEVMKQAFKGSAEDLELFRKAVGGTLGSGALIRLSNQASDLGVTLDQQAMLFSLAEDSADKYGTGVEEGFNKILMASEGAGKGIKALGIQTKAFKERVEELAKAQGDSIANLDADTQKQIRLQAIIELSGITLEKVKNKVQDNADRYVSLGIAVEAGHKRIGRFISDAILPLIQKFTDSDKSAKDFIGTVVAIGSVALSLVPMIMSVVIAKASLAMASTKSAQSITAETIALRANTGAMGQNLVASSGWLAKSKGIFGKIGLGWASAIGVGFGIGLGKLWDYVEENKIKNGATQQQNGLVQVGKNFASWIKEGFQKTFNFSGWLKEQVDKAKAKENLQVEAPPIKIDNAQRTYIDEKGNKQTVKIKVSTEADKIANNKYEQQRKEILDKYVAMEKEANQTTLKNAKDKSEAIVELKKKETQELLDLDVSYGFAKEKVKKETEEELRTNQQITAEYNRRGERIKTLRKEMLDVNTTVERQKQIQGELNILANQQSKGMPLTMKNMLKSMQDSKFELITIQKILQLNNLTLEEKLVLIERELELRKQLKELESPLTPEPRPIMPPNVEKKPALEGGKEGEVRIKPFTPEEAEDKKLFDKVPEPKKPDPQIKKTLEMIMEAGDEFEGSMSEAIGSANRLAGILGIGAHTFIGTLLSGLNTALDFANSIIGIMQLFTPMGGGGILSIIGGLFAHSGGTFENGRKIASFASGGDFIVPAGFPNDSYPMLVESGERVTVTPAGQSPKGNGMDTAMLNQINNSVRALTKTLYEKKTAPVIYANIDSLRFTEREVNPSQKIITKNNKKY